MLHLLVIFLFLLLNGLNWFLQRVELRLRGEERFVSSVQRRDSDLYEEEFCLFFVWVLFL